MATGTSSGNITLEMATGPSSGNITLEVYKRCMRGQDIRGFVATLNRLRRNDQLSHLDGIGFGRTPLHISALLGHLDFTRALLDHRPQLAGRLDSFERSPLHLASAAGHGEVVQALLGVPTNPDVCLHYDLQGRIPLHLAAMTGRVEVIEKLIRANATSLQRRVERDGKEEDTVLHLCVRKNHLDALKLLVASVDDEAFLNLANHEGETILKLSARLKQLETFRYLLSVRQISVDVDSKMDTSFFTEYDIKQEGLIRASNTEGRGYEFLDSEWLKEMRGHLMVAATVFAGMSYQAGISAPGGFWQVDTNKTQDGCPKGLTCKAGTAILSYTHPKYYKWFTRLNFAAVLFSFMVIIALIVGRIKKHNLGPLVIFMLSAIKVLIVANCLCLWLVSDPRAL